jgi:PKHD-type hydroxylase
MESILTFENFLSIDECDFILSKCKEELISPNKKLSYDVSNHRKSSIATIYGLEFLNERLLLVIKNSFNIHEMEINGLDDIRFTEYQVGEYFEWHVDSSKYKYEKRFISIVIQLNDGYDGGIFEIKDFKGTKVLLTQKKGNLYIFNSKLFHRVTEITSGIRHSLVIWVSLSKPNLIIQKIL